MVSNVGKLRLDNFHPRFWRLSLWRENHVRTQISDHKTIYHILKHPSLVSPPIALIMNDWDSFFVWSLRNINNMFGVIRPKDTASTQIFIKINFLNLPIGDEESRIKRPNFDKIIHPTGAKVFSLILIRNNPEEVFVFCYLCSMQFPKLTAWPIAFLDGYLFAPW